MCLFVTCLISNSSIADDLEYFQGQLKFCQLPLHIKLLCSNLRLEMFSPLILIRSAAVIELYCCAVVDFMANKMLVSFILVVFVFSCRLAAVTAVYRFFTVMLCYFHREWLSLLHCLSLVAG